MGCFPLYVDISNKNCVVVGGGNTAARKIEKLLLFNAKVTVIAPDICEEITKIKDIKIIKRKFEDSDLNGAFIVVGATDDDKTNSRISQICREKKYTGEYCRRSAELQFLFSLDRQKKQYYNCSFDRWKSSAYRRIFA